MIIQPLLQEQTFAQGGATHVAIVYHPDLTDAVAGEAQVINLAAVVAKINMQLVHAKLVTPFSASADPANNSTAVIVGDSNSTNRYLTTMELNAAAPVYEQLGVAANRTYTAADNVTATFTPAGGKTLLALDAGEVHFYLKQIDGR